MKQLFGYSFFQIQEKKETNSAKLSWYFVIRDLEQWFRIV